MSWLTDIIARLKANGTLAALVGTRIYAQVAPSDATTPYIVWERSSVTRVDSHDGASGLATQMLQVNCLDEDYLDALAVADAVRGAVDGFDGTMGSTAGVRIRFISGGDLPNMDPSNEARQIHGIFHEYEVWHNE